MKVIKKGKWSKEVTCKGCSSVLLAEAEDIRTGSWGSFGEYETEYYVWCPECRERCVIKDRDIPEHAKEMASHKSPHRESSESER